MRRASNLDLRGYGLPFHPGLPIRPQRMEKVQSRNPYLYPLENWDDSPRKATPSFASHSRQTPIDENDDEEEQSWIGERYIKPSKKGSRCQARLELYLHSLYQEIVQALNLYQDIYRDFETAIEKIAEWAPASTLDTIWSDRIKKMEHNKLEDVAEKIVKCRGDLKNAKGDGRVDTTVADEKKLLLENQLRAAHKAMACCDGIVDLARRALKDRLACKQLVRELTEAEAMLNRESHPWIYGDKEEGQTTQ